MWGPPSEKNISSELSWPTGAEQWAMMSSNGSSNSSTLSSSPVLAPASLDVASVLKNGSNGGVSQSSYSSSSDASSTLGFSPKSSLSLSNTDIIATLAHGPTIPGFDPDSISMHPPPSAAGTQMGLPQFVADYPSHAFLTGALPKNFALSTPSALSVQQHHFESLRSPHPTTPYIGHGSQSQLGISTADPLHASRLPPHGSAALSYRVYVAGLDPEVSFDALHAYFSNFGPVADVYLPKTFNTGKTQPFGFVTFATAEGFAAALAAEHRPNGKQLSVSAAQPKTGPADLAERRHDRPDMNSAPPVRRDFRLFVGRILEHVDESRLWQHFEAFGGLTDVYLPKSYHSGKPKGFGFVTFVSGAAMNAALAKPVHTIDGAELEVKRAQPREAAPLSAGNTPSQGVAHAPHERLFVGRLPEFLDEHALRAHFEQFGAIADVYMPKEYNSGKPKGFGFVTFLSDASVSAALAAGPFQLDGCELDLKRAQPKEANQRAKEALKAAEMRAQYERGRMHAPADFNSPGGVNGDLRCHHPRPQTQPMDAAAINGAAYGAMLQSLLNHRAMSGMHGLHGNISHAAGGLQGGAPTCHDQLSSSMGLANSVAVSQLNQQLCALQHQIGNLQLAASLSAGRLATPPRMPAASAGATPMSGLPQRAGVVQYNGNHYALSSFE